MESALLSGQGNKLSYAPVVPEQVSLIDPLDWHFILNKPGLALTFLIMIIFFWINLHFIGAIFWRPGLVKIHSYAPESNLIPTS